MTRNLRWGIEWGLIGGAFFGLIALLAVVVQALNGWPDDGVHPLLVILAYPLAGAVGGVFLGLLRPLLTSRRRAMAVGVLVAVPTLTALMPMAVGSPLRWGGAEWFAILFSSLLFGSAAGYKWWELKDFGPGPEIPGPLPRADRRRLRRERARSPRR